MGHDDQLSEEKKIDIYYEIAKDINPDVEIELYHEGLTVDNFREIIEEADVFVRAIDYQCCTEVKDLTFPLLKEYNIPLFQTAAYGYGAILHCYHPKISMECSVPLYKYRNFFLKGKSEERFVKYYKDDHNLTSNSTSNTLSGLLLSSEILVYLLQETDVVSRKPIFYPNFVLCDFFSMKMEVKNVLS